MHFSLRFSLIVMACCLLGARSVEPTASPNRMGKDFALFFAVDSYQDPTFIDLRNPIRDAEAIATELETHFGFETEIHRNPGYRKIRQVLSHWQQKSFDNDAQLFIFFSGHGAVDELDDKGYFMPADVQRGGLGQYGLESLSSTINRIPCPHILMAVDACYSGMILEKSNEDNRPAPRRLGETAETHRARVISTELAYPSRFILTSGGRERTPDGRYHSPFTEGILSALAQSLREDGLVIWEQLTFDMRTEVKNPRPHYGTFDGHRTGGGFVFVRTDVDYTPITQPIVQPVSPKEIPQNNLLDQIPTPKMMEIPEGTFTMGQPDPNISNYRSDDEQPPHQVHISRFALSETEVTNSQFCAFLNAKGNQKEGGTNWLGKVDDFEKRHYNIEDNLLEDRGGLFLPKPGYEDHPVILVSWYAAQAYCKWLSELSGEDYRLPTEAEWEYAAGGGPANRTKWAGTNNGNNLRSYANFMDKGGQDSYVHSAPVKSFKPNRLGLYDMSGNVCEWCADAYDENYYQYCVENNLVRNPQNTKKDRFASVIRGCSWVDNVLKLRVAFRDWGVPEARRISVGFRIAKSLR